MVVDEFVDPNSKMKLNKDESENLHYLQGDKCITYVSYGGTYDFVCNNNSVEERTHYERKYAEESLKCLTIQDCYKEWTDKSIPENLVMLKSLGDLSGKKILLIGNGTSFKELYFLCLGAEVVFTDLSLEAVKFVKGLFSFSEIKAEGYEKIEFHAVDALHLPFADASFDIIYGYAFVHHLRELDSLFSEIDRCLKKGGICRFLDEAYSPIWQFTKNTFLKPLQLYSHIKTGISPEDLRATKKGGYRKSEMTQIMQKVGFTKLLFERVSFFQHLWRRGIIKLFGGSDYLIRKGTPIMTGLDNFLTIKFHFMKRNLIRLVWGFNK